MAEHTALFAGGPLHGKVITVDSLTFITLEPAATPGALPWDVPDPRQVAYHLHRFALLGRVIWIAYIAGREPGEPELFDLIASDDAKRAAS